MIGLMSMKGMFMSGLTMMMMKAMLIMQLIAKKGGGGGGGGGGWSSGGGGHGGGGGGYGPPAVPSSSYGPPSSGWGRSFNDRLSIMNPSHQQQSNLVNDYPEIDDSTSIVNSYPQTEERFNVNQDWTGNLETNENRVGEVHEVGIERNSNPIKIEDKNKFLNSKPVYANEWKNYEIADKILDRSVGPIVARKITPK